MMTGSLLVYLALPLGLFFGFDLYKPAWLKFLVIVLPAFHVMVAHGVETVSAILSAAWRGVRSRPGWVRPVVSGVLAVGLGALVVPSLRSLYWDPAYARDDYRALAAHIRHVRRPGDAVVLNAPNQWEVFTYYYPDRDVYPAPYRPGPGKAAAFLAPLIDEYERLFVLYWGHAESDPQKRVETWLADHAYKAHDRWYGDVRLATYGVAPLPEVPAERLGARFGESIRLEGYTRSGAVFCPEDIVPITLFWEALGTVDQSYKVTVQMLDKGGRLVSQTDAVPGDGLAPTDTWEPGSEPMDRFGLSVPEDAPSGHYRLIVALYRADTGERLPVVMDGQARDDYVTLGAVFVAADGG